MSDVSRHLPLSHRERLDESSVSADWSAHTGATLLRVADLLDSLDTSDSHSHSDSHHDNSGWGAATMRTDFTVRDVAAHILWRIGTPRRARVAAVARLVVTAGRPPRAAKEQLAREFATRSPETLAADVRALALHCAAGGAGGGTGARIGDLETAVVGAVDIASALGTRIEIDPVASGAVALRLAVSAPLPIRAVLRERSLHAANAGWSVGRGPSLRATEAGIIQFLAGRNAESGRLPDAVPEEPS